MNVPSALATLTDPENTSSPNKNQSQGQSSVESTASSSPPATTATSTSTNSTPSVTISPSSSTDSMNSPLIPASSSTTSGKSVGIVAGAAIGSAVGAAILAALLTYLLMRRRSRKGREIEKTLDSPVDTLRYPLEKGRFSERTTEHRSGFGDWTKHLPQPTDDVSIGMAIRTILQQIELHVDNFYSNMGLTWESIPESALTELLKMDTGLIQPSLSALMMGTRPKTTLLKHLLAHLILSNITVEGSAPGSFLPRDISSLYKSMEDAAKHQEKPAIPQALSAFRLLTCYLRPNPFRDLVNLTEHDNTIEDTATMVCLAFAPWASRRASMEARCDNLNDIMRGAAATGVLLFSQRASFKFDWDHADRDQRSRTIVVLPGFTKVTDDKARTLREPLVFVSQIVGVM